MFLEFSVPVFSHFFQLGIFFGYFSFSSYKNLVSALARVNESMYAQDGFVLPNLMYKAIAHAPVVTCLWHNPLAFLPPGAANIYIVYAA
jgi:hypothetical protein